jgi:hypothetical protein
MWKEKATVFLTPSGDEWSGGLAGEVRAAMPRGSVKVCFRPERRKSYRPRPLWKAGSKKLPAQEESCHLHRPEQFCVCVGVCGCVCVCRQRRKGPLLLQEVGLPEAAQVKGEERKQLQARFKDEKIKV